MLRVFKVIEMLELESRRRDDSLILLLGVRITASRDVLTIFTPPYHYHHSSGIADYDDNGYPSGGGNSLAALFLHVFWI